MERTAVLLDLPADAPQRLRSGAARDARLEPELERHGIDSLAILVSGSQAVVHGEAETRDRLADLLAGPAAAELLGPAAGEVPPMEEIFAWETPPASERIERTALILQLQEGREPEYRAWLESDALDTLITLWNRNRIWRHDVLLHGTTVVAYYELEDKHNVLKAFREPEALEMLMQDLSKILVLDPYTPIAPFDAVLFARARSEAQT